MSSDLCTALVAVLLAMQGAGAPASREELLWQYRNLGKAFYENPVTHPEAAEQFRKALALAPDSTRERLNYGLALLRAGEVDQGIAQLEKVQRQDPALPHTWFNLGVEYKKKGEYPRALEQFRHMAQLVPDEPITHYNLGLLDRLAGDNQAALREYATAAGLDPNFVAPRFQIFDVWREAENTAESQRALAEFMRVKKRQEEADAPAEDPNWSYYSEIYDPIEAQAPPSAPAELRFLDRALPGAADPTTAGLLLLDADGDGFPDLLVWSKLGILLYRSGTEPVDAGLAAVRDVVSVAAGDYNNDGLPDLCIVTKTGATLYLNEKGVFHKDPRQPPNMNGVWAKAVWLDYDHDYDLDLLLLGERSVLLRNQGDEGFQDHTADFPFAPGRALDAAAFRLTPDTKGFDLVVSYQDRPAVLYRDLLAGSYQAVPLPSMPTGATSIVPFDFDNDSWIDLAFVSEGKATLLHNERGKFAPLDLHPVAQSIVFADLAGRGAADLVANQVFSNQGRGRFAPPASPAGFSPALRWTAAGFGRDGRPDLAGIAADGGIHLLRNRTAGANHWLPVWLEGVKNLKLAPGAEVEVKAGAAYQKQLYGGVPLLFGLGDRKLADTIRVTWPNGMIQNMTSVPAGQRVPYKEAPRLSGSCPMIFPWNGSRFEFLTDVLGVAPLGARAGDGRYFPVDHDEYVQIPAAALVARNGRYDIHITEELSEVTYLDQVRLIAVDHPAGAEIFTNDKWKSPPFPDFRLFGVKRRIYPRAAHDTAGRDLLAAIARRDGIYAAGFRRNDAGVAETHVLDLDFAGAAPHNRAVLVLNGWVDWADGSTFYAAAQESRDGLTTPYLQVKDAAGRWQTVIDDMGMPSGKTKTIAVDLTGKFLSASREIRIVTNLCVYWDEIFLAEDADAPEARLTPLDAESADLHFRGFSRAHIDPERRQPEYFDYSQVSLVSQWNPTPGWYTRYGDVRELLAQVDDRLVIMGSGDELRLSFAARGLPALPRGWTRDFLLLVDGWAKDRDANTAFSQTVEPLPFHAMSTYPYPAPEAYPGDSVHEAYRKEWNTRPALRLIRSLADAR